MSVYWQLAAVTESGAGTVAATVFSPFCPKGVIGDVASPPLRKAAALLKQIGAHVSLFGRAADVVGKGVFTERPRCSRLFGRLIPETGPESVRKDVDLQGARLGQRDGGVGAQADIPAPVVDYDSLDPGLGAGGSDVKVEVVPIAVPALLMALTESGLGLPITHLNPTGLPRDEWHVVAFYGIRIESLSEMYQQSGYTTEINETQGNRGGKESGGGSGILNIFNP